MYRSFRELKKEVNGGTVSCEESGWKKIEGTSRKRSRNGITTVGLRRLRRGRLRGGKTVEQSKDRELLLVVVVVVRWAVTTGTRGFQAFASFGGVKPNGATAKLLESVNLALPFETRSLSRSGPSRSIASSSSTGIHSFPFLRLYSHFFTAPGDSSTARELGLADPPSPYVVRENTLSFTSSRRFSSSSPIPRPDPDS